jgi:peptidoglycan hydrolase CwlO-like protein
VGVKAAAAPRLISEDREFQRKKSELEEKLERLESERASLITEVEGLRQRRTLLELEKKSASLQATVDMLKMEKTDLEGQIASIEGTQ